MIKMIIGLRRAASAGLLLQQCCMQCSLSVKTRAGRFKKYSSNAALAKRR